MNLLKSNSYKQLTFLRIKKLKYKVDFNEIVNTLPFHFLNGSKIKNLNPIYISFMNLFKNFKS